MATKYQKALTAFNRSAGQLKRYYDITPSKYLEGVKTAAGVERALKQMRFEAEQQQVAHAVEKYERETRVLRLFHKEQKKIRQAQAPKFYYDEAKQAAYEESLNQYNTAADSFLSNWSGFTRESYDDFVAFIGALPDEYKSDEAFGSKSIVEAYRTAKKAKLTDDELVKTLGRVLAKNKSGNQEDVINDLYDEIALLGKAKEEDK